MFDQIVNRFMSKTKDYSKADQAKIRQAAEYAAEKHKDQKRQSGEPYIIHPIAVAQTLIGMNMDVNVICAALLHDVMEDQGVTKAELQAQFGDMVADLVEAETKTQVKAAPRSVQEAETLRNMFFSMNKHLEVIIIKLADKLHNMETLQYKDASRAREIAQDCLDIYAPLADRLGIAWMKNRLEDLAFKNLNPDVFEYIQSYLDKQIAENQDYLGKIEKAIFTACHDAGFKEVKVFSRTKHAYSVYMKMKKRNKDIDEIFDILGVRIICSNVLECYSILGIIHSNWPPTEGRFKDYIAMPKANNYQSLHTTVMGPGGRMLEIQIRTTEMNQIAENGVASHWQYKMESGSSSKDWSQMDHEQIARVTARLRNWTNEISQSESFMEDIKSEILQDSIYVFTPKGTLIDLPSGATALDFAFHIHTEIGVHCTGAKADGSIISLGEPLKNTQVVEILTSTNAHPKVEWLRLAHTTSARRKIRNWLNKNDPSLVFGKNIIAKTKPIEEPVALPPLEPLKDEDIVRTVTSEKSRDHLVVGDDKNILISIAQCCNPTHGDDIVGYISRGRGIIVHRADCPNLKNMPEIELRRTEVVWEDSSVLNRSFRVTSKRTQDLFSEIEGAIRKFKGHLIEGKLTDDEEGRLIGTFTMECEKEEDFKKIVKAIRSIPSIIQISQKF